MTRSLEQREANLKTHLKRVNLYSTASKYFIFSSAPFTERETRHKIIRILIMRGDYKNYTKIPTPLLNKSKGHSC